MYNFVVGVRGGGKTFNTLAFCIHKFLKNDKKFIFLRRTVVDLEEACVGNKKGNNAQDLFFHIRRLEIFKDKEFKVTKDGTGGFIFYCGEKVMGYGKALSTAGKRRGGGTDVVDYLIFDEFLIDSKNKRDRYLDNETFLFHNFYETHFRMRDVPIFFIGNAFSMVNPYFIEFGIDRDLRNIDIEDNKVYKGKFWTFVSWRDPEYIKAKQGTQFYQATKNTKFSEHAYENNYYLDKNDFIQKRAKNSEHIISLVYLGKTYGVWVEWDAGLFYISTKGAETSANKTISLSLADNKPNNVNIRRYRTLPFIKYFRSAVDENKVYYDSQQTYEMMNEAVYLLRTIT